jgi:phosphatidate cytidylyltransferase
MPVKRRAASIKGKDHHKAAVKDSAKTEEEPATVLLAAEAPSKKWHNWWIRTITTLMMIAAFFLVLASGYIWSIVTVLVITVLVYREVISIAYYSAKGNLSWFKTMSWSVKYYIVYREPLYINNTIGTF